MVQFPARRTLILAFSLREKEPNHTIISIAPLAAIDLPLPLGERRVRAAERASLLTK
jgi:hypothetical protein